jgi:predicted amidohydrolase
MVKITCVELPDSPTRKTWNSLSEHVQERGTEILVLNEMPFYPWFVLTKEFKIKTAEDAVRSHDESMSLLNDLGCKHVIASRPVIEDGKLYNEAFILTEKKYTPVHVKHFLPEESGFFEDSWFSRKPPLFDLFDVGQYKAGIMLCTELWFSEYARSYGKKGAHFIMAPRATKLDGLVRWKVGFRYAAIVSGSYVVTSNRSGKTVNGDFAGYGCIVDPDGEIISHTSKDNPYVTIDLDPARVVEAKKSYPRYVKEAAHESP